MASRDGKMPCYNKQTVICHKNKLIATNRISDKANDRNHLESNLIQLEEELGVIPEKANADSDYFKITAIRALTYNEAGEKQTDIFVPVPKNASPRQVDLPEGGTLEFVYDPQKDTYSCSMGTTLVRKYKVTKNERSSVYYQGTTCGNCKIKELCCPRAKHGRRVYRYEDQRWKDDFKKKMSSLRGRLQIRKRKAHVEHPFGTIKLWMGKIPLRLRGMEKVQNEANLWHFAYNFKRMTNIATFEEYMCLIQSYKATA